MNLIIILIGTFAFIIQDSASLKIQMPLYNDHLKLWNIRTKLNMAGFGNKPLSNEGTNDMKSLKKQIMTINDNDNCVCCSGIKYENCCKPFHNDTVGDVVVEPKSIVRARYSGYAFGLGDFLIQTTHKTHKAG